MTNDMRVFLKTLCAIFATLVMTVLWMWFTIVMFMRLVFLGYIQPYRVIVIGNHLRMADEKSMAVGKVCQKS